MSNPTSSAPGPAINVFPALKTLYEDEHVLAIDKPTGIASNPQKNGRYPSVMEAVCARLSKDTEKIPESGLLHRLDVHTSGVLVIAKNAVAYQELKTHWKTEKIVKTYEAVCVLTPKAKPLSIPLTIDRPIGHSAKSKSKMIVLPSQQKIRGEPQLAITHILKAEQFRSNDIRLLSLKLEIDTGVMHQIRVHLLSLGLPILGDPLYGKAYAAKRMYLHAVEVRWNNLSIPNQKLSSPVPWNLENL